MAADSQMAWRPEKDPKSGGVYWWNVQTHEVSWDKPSGAGAGGPKSAHSSPLPPPSEAGVEAEGGARSNKPGSRTKPGAMDPRFSPMSTPKKATTNPSAGTSPGGARTPYASTKPGQTSAGKPPRARPSSTSGSAPAPGPSPVRNATASPGTSPGPNSKQPRAKQGANPNSNVTTSPGSRPIPGRGTAGPKPTGPKPDSKQRGAKASSNSNLTPSPVVNGKRAPPRDARVPNGGGWDTNVGSEGEEEDPYAAAAEAAASATLVDNSVNVADLEGGWLAGSPRVGQGAAHPKGRDKDKGKGQLSKRSSHSEVNEMPEHVARMFGMAPNSADIAGGGDAAGGGSSSEAGGAEDGGAPATMARKQKEKGKKRAPQNKEVFYSKRPRFAFVHKHNFHAPTFVCSYITAQLTFPHFESRCADQTDSTGGLAARQPCAKTADDGFERVLSCNGMGVGRVPPPREAR